MKVLQFEPFLWNDVVDYPDLGVAMLMGTYRHAGIDAELVVTQLECIRMLFTCNGGECYRLFQTLSEEQQRCYPLLFSFGQLFPEKLSSLYDRYYSKSWSDYLTAPLTEQFHQTFLELVRLNFEALAAGNCQIPIVKWLARRISETYYDVICVSLYELHQNNDLLLRQIYRISHDCGSYVILGGAFSGHMTVEDVQSLRERGYGDFVFVGPGEENLVPLLRTLERGEMNPDIPNVIPLQFDCPIRLDKRPVRQLAELPPPDYSQSTPNRYPCPVPILPLQTARGCTWRKCTFCSHHNGYYGEYHAFPIPIVADIIASLQEAYRCDHFVLHDDDIPAARLLNLCRELRERDLHCYLYCYVRADEVFLTDGLLEEIYQCGVRTLSWGIESGSQTLLDQVHKGTHIDHARLILERCHKVGISNICWMMINLWGETEKDFEKSVHFMSDTANDVDLWLVSPFRPQYDSPIYETIREQLPPRTPFTYSAKLPLALQRLEATRRERMNNLFGMGAFLNPAIPEGCVPNQSQRARLIPYMLSSRWKAIPENHYFQIVPLCKKRKVGNRTFLVFSKQRRQLNERELDTWQFVTGRTVVTPLDIALLDGAFLAELIAQEWIWILPQLLEE